MMINVKRTPPILMPDQARVPLSTFIPGDSERSRGIIRRLISLDEGVVNSLLASVLTEFCQRHRDIRTLFLDRFEQIWGTAGTAKTISEQRKPLIGAYFLAEYSLESAALFNPSIVPDPDQTELPPGALRFILSLRPTGERHILPLPFVAVLFISISALRFWLPRAS
jgi:hypothetical protein